MAAPRDMPRQAGSRWALPLRIAASVLILAALLWFVRSENLLARLLALRPGWLAISMLCLAMVFICNTLRWQMLLHGYELACGFVELLLLYTVAHFFTLFLPGTVGSDGVRSLYIARRYGKPAAVLLATLQERLAGLGALLVLGLVSTLAMRALLGPTLVSTLVIFQLGTLLLVVGALFPGPALAIGRRLWHGAAVWPPLTHLASRPLFTRLARFLAPAAAPLRLSRSQVALLVLALAGSTLFGVATYWSLAQALGVQIPWLAVAVATSVVTLARTLPVSINGIGVGEGAFVVMLAPFGVAPADALAISLAGLAIHSVAALVGGLCYAVMLNRGLRIDASQKVAP